MILTGTVATEWTPLTASGIIVVACSRGRAISARCAGEGDETADAASSWRSGVHILWQRERGCAAVAVVSYAKYIEAVFKILFAMGQ